MIAPEIRPLSLNEDDTEWAADAPLIFGGRVERRRSAPMAGWYVIRDNRASGPFATVTQAQRWAAKKGASPSERLKRAA